MTISNEQGDKITAKKIAHPIFAECAQYTLDPYWKQLFEECSKGKFPRGFNLDQKTNTIYIRSKSSHNKSYISYQLIKNPDQIYKDLKKLFQEHLHYRSNKDRHDNRVELDNICKDLQKTYNEGWNKIRRKKIKEPIIRQYILNLKEEYQLTDTETTALAKIIKLGFLFNWIANEDVEYEDQCITNIATLHYDPDERIFKLEEPTVECKREYKPKLIKLSSLWDKYLSQPKNRYFL
jgi:hypothetical protein